MYGLPQAGRIAYDELVTHMAKYDYHPCKRTAGLWGHKTRDINFTLVVDDFGIKYVGEDNAQHLIDTIKAKYKCTVDRTGNLYCGITLDWDYDNRTVDISMPGYVEKALHRFQHETPKRPEDAPSQWTAPTYGSRSPQLTKPADSAKKLDPKGINKIQQISGVFLYYAQAVTGSRTPRPAGTRRT